MSNDPSESRSMRRQILIAFFCAITIVACAKHEHGTEQTRVASDTARTTDTARTADSSAQGSVAPPMKILSYEETQGAVLYGKYCAVCHGAEGKGDGFNAFNLDPHPRDFSDSTYMKALSDGQIVQTISGGGRSVNKSPLMPAYGWTLGKQQIRYVASYVRTFIDQDAATGSDTTR
jgi:mono/diheme cytochrome c family protein